VPVAGPFTPGNESDVSGNKVRNSFCAIRSSTEFALGPRISTANPKTKKS